MFPGPGDVIASVKKAKHGIATPKRDLELIRARLQEVTRLRTGHEGA